MENIKDKLKQLLKQTNWTSDDRQWLLTFLDSDDAILLRELLREEFFEDLQVVGIHQDEKAREILEKIHQRIVYYESKTKPKTPFFFKWTAVAASLILFVSFAIFLYKSDKTNETISSVKKGVQGQLFSNDLAPGGEKAVLTLADGSVVILDDVSNGHITQQEKVDIEKLNEGELRYSSSNEIGILAYNSISTPRGGKFQITLSDGSKVWLNAASSLRFPVHFIGKERRVELIGEGYFEIAKDKSRPFIVDVAGKEEVEVLGTHFNINSYSDEASINTTLLEGSVSIKVKGSNDPRLLIPGQQFILLNSGKSKIKEDVNLEETIAWKEGKFHFGESMDLEQVMRQIGRWYDVDIQYEGDFSGIHLGGTISRNVSASKVFEMLEMTEVAKFSIEGRKVTVAAQKK